MEKYTYHDVNRRGTITKITYTTTNEAGELREKYANIYLPYGYEQEEKNKKYNVLYVIHGGGGNPDAWLDCCKIKNMLDYMIDTKEVEPLLVVFPSFYKEKIGRNGPPVRDIERSRVLFFQKELREDLLPAIESQYHTYTEEITPEGFQRSRMHRGICGFSMGGAATWFAFLHNINYFAYYVPLSGDCWEIEGQGGLTKPEETARALCEQAVSSGYKPEEYFIYTATGTKDIAYEALNGQVGAMRKYPDIFVENEDLAKGNFHYLLAEGEVHAYEAVYQYLYHILPYVFKRA
ncbi:alpha/beta hydrolase-fold protein [Faecalicatena acetigenes]|uniref:Alpha/beta hydrolase-fold protein n=1 Tax=Faecalicatena acetigenes TaxID=2981790 RepID=A0ABT2T797_9FIRM|nr:MULTISPECIES: alpha/beta hydrolase-fold protein [Lachnospiraceae]MCU6746138.1 alpha/beta hydrolase-fold protein [Faecalicatena acetigenes]SCG97429.1 Endo-1%2C4-beta-xylanase Y precursor [uncultured Clostridium sp.]